MAHLMTEGDFVAALGALQAVTTPHEPDQAEVTTPRALQVIHTHVPAIPAEQTRFGDRSDRDLQVERGLNFWRPNSEYVQAIDDELDARRERRATLADRFSRTDEEDMTLLGQVRRVASDAVDAYGSDRLLTQGIEYQRSALHAGQTGEQTNDPVGAEVLRIERELWQREIAAIITEGRTDVARATLAVIQYALLIMASDKALDALSAGEQTMTVYQRELQQSQQDVQDNRGVRTRAGILGGGLAISAGVLKTLGLVVATVGTNGWALVLAIGAGGFGVISGFAHRAARVGQHKVEEMQENKPNVPVYRPATQY